MAFVECVCCVAMLVLCVNCGMGGRLPEKLCP